MKQTITLWLASALVALGQVQWAVHNLPAQLDRRGVVDNGPSSNCGPAVRQGDAATARLKEQGHHEYPMQAVQAARYAVETVEVGPAISLAGVRYAGNPAHALRCWFRADGLELQSAGATKVFDIDPARTGAFRICTCAGNINPHAYLLLQNQII